MTNESPIFETPRLCQYFHHLRLCPCTQMNEMATFFLQTLCVAHFLVWSVFCLFISPGKVVFLVFSGHSFCPVSSPFHSIDQLTLSFPFLSLFLSSLTLWLSVIYSIIHSISSYRNGPLIFVISSFLFQNCPKCGCLCFLWRCSSSPHCTRQKCSVLCQKQKTSMNSRKM